MLAAVRQHMSDGTRTWPLLVQRLGSFLTRKDDNTAKMTTQQR